MPLPAAIAKRSTPEPVAPVVANHVEYSAPHELMGIVVATDLATGKELWCQRIYQVPIHSRLESDVQDVFITSLSINKKRVLTVINEKGAIYTMDLMTRKVTKQNNKP